jgi:radical SAM superfamily enzyme YgiQ (UPF0313 family)
MTPPYTASGGRTRTDKRRVILYNPRTVFWTMPLALVAIASALDPDRFEVVIVDGRLVGDPVTAVLEEIDATTVCVGVTVLTGAPILDALRVTRAVRTRRPELPIVWGGWHPSLFPEQCVTEGRVDAVVIGQGERSFRELVDRWAVGGTADGVAGCAHPGGHGVVLEPRRAIADVNELPAHDYSRLDVPRYFAGKRRRQLDYVSSQGCRFRCEFCADPFVYKRTWSGFAPERVGEELAALWRAHVFDDLNFQDETFFTHSRRAAAIAEQLLRRGVRTTWAATMRADQGVRLDERALIRCSRLPSGFARTTSAVSSRSSWVFRTSRRKASTRRSPRSNGSGR